MLVQHRPGSDVCPTDRQGLGADYVGDSKTLNIHVKLLRAKTEDGPADPKLLTTVRGLGYKLVLPKL